MQPQTLTIGMPAGSLANASRGGNLIQLLEVSGFKTSGYDAGGPSKFTTVTYLYGWDGRPQEFGSQLGIGELDVAIAGDDWIKERTIELKLEYNVDVQLKRVLALNRGGVKIVGITKSNEFTTTSQFLKNFFSKNTLLTVVSEMPYLALNWLQGKMKEEGLFYQFPEFSVQKYKTPSRIKKGILVYETWGKTESKVMNEGADIGLEITQSGSAIRNYGLKIIDTVLESETAIYINPSLKKNKEKTELLRIFLLNLYGAVNAENKVMILFNVSNNNAAAIEKYLSENKLFASEPTVSRGHEFTEYSVQVDTSDKRVPLAKIRYDLAVLNAKHIDTIPINSSIPGIDVIDI
jgi:ATP phosphoribosyltransferase